MDIFLMLLCLLLSALCSAADTAICSANRGRLKNAAQKKRFRLAAHIAKSPAEYDAAVQIVQAAATVGFVLTAAIFADIPLPTAARAVMAAVLLLILSAVFSAAAQRKPEETLAALAMSTAAARTICYPLVCCVMGLKGLTRRLVGGTKKPTVTEEELKDIIDEIRTEGVLEEHESQLVRSALDFDETAIEEVLVARVNVVGVERSRDMEEIKELFIENRYSRMPVYEKTLDSIVGVIHQSDFFALYTSGGRDIDSIMKKPLFVPEGERISEVMKLMQKNKAHMAVVVDQYGGTEGICTLEDIIEELVGDIYDESDEEDVSFITLSENRWQVSAELSVYDFLAKAGLAEELIEADSNSLGGWVVESLERFPEHGETVEIPPFTVSVKMEDAQRIEKLMIELLCPIERIDTENA